MHQMSFNYSENLYTLIDPLQEMELDLSKLQQAYDETISTIRNKEQQLTETLRS